MPLQGVEIYRGYDALGVVQVMDDGHKRYLSFGAEDEQSCVLKDQPWIPQMDYIRAMLLVLLFVTPRRVLVLGLGGGSLNTCLHHGFPGMQQDIVELRSEVVTIAQRFFQLPRSKRIQVHTMEAQTYLDTEAGRPADIIFSDIYDDQGVSEQQHQPAYLHECHARLRPNGWLVLNCWKEHRGEAVLEVLREQFAQVYSCTTQDGNWVVFAGKSDNFPSQSQLKQTAKQLSQSLGFSLSGYLNRLV
ncbi:MAG: spermidine synthase [Nitrincola lacisaponensis]|uniref:spermidine synthase n=1 Tax=Nitrincola lacisaponensis TaxID=267850 RepID=UPI0039199FFD